MRLVGRPGLDPGTLGIGPEHAAPFVVVRITWSEQSSIPPASTEILSNLIPWLHNWLHSLGNEAVGDVTIRGKYGLEINVRIENLNQ